MKFWALALALASPAAAQVSTDLGNLYQSNRWFEFRDAMLRAPRAAPFYRGKLAMGFNDWPHAERDLRMVMKSSADPGQAFEAGMGLLRMYDIAGRRKDVRALLADLGSILRTQRKTEVFDAASFREFESYRKLWNAESEYPDQMVVARGRSRLNYSEVENRLIVPLTINGIPANYEIDTGSDTGIINVAEAKRLGLKIHRQPVDIDDELDPAMKGVGVAVADDLAIGNFHFRNVYFLVEKGDDDLSGLIGLSVLLPMETMRWSSDGSIEFGFPAHARDIAQSNVCLADPTLLARAELDGKDVMLGLDTGSFESMLFPRFSRDFADRMKRPIPLGRRAAPKGSQAVALAGLRIGGLQTALAPTPVYAKEPVEEGVDLHGWLGMDLLGQARSVTLDFVAMKLTLDGIDRAEPSISAHAECPLPPDFRCLPGFKCIVKAASDAPCFVERLPAVPAAGNAVESEPEEAGNCYLPAVASCEHGMECRAVFDSNQSCHIESKAGAARVRTPKISAAETPPAAAPTEARENVARSLK
jgi:hypothetical protein